jgi:hypothetical protein
MAEAKYVRQEMEYKRGADYEEWKQQREQALNDSHQHDHLTGEWITYLSKNPRKRSAVAELLIAKAQPLSVITPEFFEEHEATHAAIKSGVL